MFMTPPHVIPLILRNVLSPREFLHKVPALVPEGQHINKYNRNKGVGRGFSLITKLRNSQSL